ncbi:hypothetical protein HC928_00310 [bacterium]|nr:hypothetical protein [bacterium]
MISLEGLEESFDNDEAAELLSLSFDKMTTTSDLLRKSLYDFDLETPEGIEKLMALLPIMDPEILKDIMTEIWPNYPTELDPRRHRMEIKGYLKDYLDSYDSTDATDQPEVEGGDAGGGEGLAEEPAAAAAGAVEDTSGSPEPDAPQTPPQPGADAETPAP